MSPLVCRYCEKKIRGNAAAESYDEASGLTSFTCATCARLFEKFLAENAPTAAQVAADAAGVVFCGTHPAARLRCPACAGSRGGAKTSPKKSRAARRNGKLGGRPETSTDDPLLASALRERAAIDAENLATFGTAAPGTRYRRGR